MMASQQHRMNRDRTDRVAELYAAGLTIKQVAAELGCAYGTTRKHLLRAQSEGRVSVRPSATNLIPGARRGRKVSEETRARMSEAAKQRWQRRRGLDVSTN